jgi:hypothetical protein
MKARSPRAVAAVFSLGLVLALVFSSRASAAEWNVYYTQATAANTASPSITAPVVAILDMHNGCIRTGGNGGCSDRSLLDFFTLAVDRSGAADIIYTSGDAAAGVNLFFTKN